MGPYLDRHDVRLVNDDLAVYFSKKEEIFVKNASWDIHTYVEPRLEKDRKVFYIGGFKVSMTSPLSVSPSSTHLVLPGPIKKIVSFLRNCDC